MDNSKNYKPLFYGKLMKIMFHIRYIDRKEVNTLHNKAINNLNNNHFLSI